MIKIVTDSACDIPPTLAQQLGINVVPVFINIGDQSYIDGVEMTRQRFYEQLPHFDSHPSTAAPPPGTFTQVYEKLAAEGANHIISIHISDKLSNTFNAARLGAEAANHIPITLIDTDQITIAAGMLVMMAAEAAHAGQSVAEINALLQQYISHTRIFGMIDTLDALRRSGRVNWAQFGFGTLLQIKPIMMIAKGEIEVVARVRTRKKALPHLQQLVEQFAPFERIAILHTHAIELAEALRQEAQDRFNWKEIPIMEVGPAVGTHLGVGAVGFACISKG